MLSPGFVSGPALVLVSESDSWDYKFHCSILGEGSDTKCQALLVVGDVWEYDSLELDGLERL